MAKRIAQVSYNIPNATLTREDCGLLISGAAFAEYALGGIEQLGIQAMPGTKFHVNSCPDPVIVGATGVYEINLSNQAVITDLYFEKESIDAINDSNGSLPLLIDIIYREG